MSTFEPVVGFSYSLVCPSCFSTLHFRCVSLYTQNISCESCQAIISLTTLQIVSSEDGRSEVKENEHGSSQIVRYSNEIEVNVGCTAGNGFGVDQVATTLHETSKAHTLPASMSPEVKSAIVDERLMSFHRMCSPLFFVTYIVEFFLFGRSKPYCMLGRVRVYRKKIPFLGYRLIPAPTTTTSYSLLSIIVAFFYTCANFAVYRCDDKQLWRDLNILRFMALILYFNMYRIAYSDPGFILPAYISGDENGGSKILDGQSVYHTQRKSPNSLAFRLKSIDRNAKEAKWQMVDGIPMVRKWCTECGFYRPVRAAHCYQCGLCVNSHDHHCVVTGSCVGSRNISYFVFFVTQGDCTAFLAGLTTFLCLYYYPGKFSVGLYWFLLVFNVAFCWILTAGAASLMLSLWYGILTASTTRERLQHVYSSKKNPFSRRWYQNIYFYLAPQKKKYSIFREEIMSRVASTDADDRHFMV